MSASSAWPAGPQIGRRQDPTRLFVGAEGTLGVITEVTPEAATAAAGDFGGGVLRRHLGQRRSTPRSALSSRYVLVVRVELLDDVMMRGINAYAKLGYREALTLFFEFHGRRRPLPSRPRLAQAIAAEHGGHGFEVGQGR